MTSGTQYNSDDISWLLLSGAAFFKQFFYTKKRRKIINFNVIFYPSIIAWCGSWIISGGKYD